MSVPKFRQLVDQLITSVDIMEQESIPFQPPFTTDGTEASQMLNDAREGVFKFSRVCPFLSSAVS